MNALTGSGMTAVELSVVVPAHNSGPLIAETARTLADRLRGRNAEIIVVENGSVDDTYARCEQIARQWNELDVAFRLMQSQQGMGNALRVGSLASRGRWVLLTADDLPFGVDDIDAADELAAAGPLPPVIIGSKAHPDSRVDRGALRAVLTSSFAILRQLVLGMRTGDPQGTVLVNGDLLRSAAGHASEPGFLFTTELIYILEALGIRPVEVPVSLAAGHENHVSRVSYADALRMGLGLFRLRMRHGRIPSVARVGPLSQR